MTNKNLCFNTVMVRCKTYFLLRTHLNSSQLFQYRNGKVQEATDMAEIEKEESFNTVMVRCKGYKKTESVNKTGHKMFQYRNGKVQGRRNDNSR